MNWHVQHQEVAKTRTKAGLILTALVLVSAVVLWRSYRSFREFSKENDAEFCQKNLEYYKSFCASFPSNCSEGPRKLARCN